MAPTSAHIIEQKAKYLQQNSRGFVKLLEFKKIQSKLTHSPAHKYSRHNKDATVKTPEDNIYSNL